ncbi:hypothetical protein C8Q70DRAFT_934038 [Cubamyces menziesii]|nr:hypothetical protein C8Q70DRAFT_934038 [Cubamyces menziesii]
MSDASIAVIGYPQDLGMCRATKRDGTRCTGWCDKRVSDVCDYHIQHAVEQKRARLESVGRDAQAKAARKISVVDSEKALQKLLQRDKEVSAREFSKRNAETVAKDGSNRKKVEKAESRHTEEEEVHRTLRNAYSAQLIRQIGFDPTAKDGRKVKDTDVQSKIELGPRPGKKSCVDRPQPSTSAASSSAAPATHDDLEYADDPDSPLHIPEAAFGRPVGLSGGTFIDLDDDDGDV